MTGSAGQGERSLFQSRPETETRLNAGHPSSVQRETTAAPASSYMLTYTVGARSTPDAYTVTALSPKTLRVMSKPLPPVCWMVPRTYIMCHPPMDVISFNLIFQGAPGRRARAPSYNG